MKFFEAQAHHPLAAELTPWGVSVLESHHANDFRMDMARHEFWQLLYVLRGSGSLALEATTHSLAPGDAAILPPGCAHAVQDRPGEPLSLYAVNVHPSLLAPYASLTAQLDNPRRLRVAGISAQMPDMLRRLLLEQSLGKPGCDAMMTGLALQLLTNLARLEYPSKNQTVFPFTSALPNSHSLLSQARMAAYLQELERQFYRNETVDQVASRLGLSRRRFTSLFREVTGTSWLPYVRQLRLEHAQRLLRESGRTVLSVAFECGFEDVSSFYRAFKTHVGQSPDQWRKTTSESTTLSG